MRAAAAGLLALLLAAAAQPARAADAAAPAAPVPEEPVVGIFFRGASRAYPLGVLARRRVVNDVVGSQEVVVFHDPERGVVAAWFRTVLGEPIEFSGKAAGVIAEDLTTITRWDLATGQAVAGSLAGKRLVAVPLKRTSWGGWAAEHPGAAVFADEGPAGP